MKTKETIKKKVDRKSAAAALGSLGGKAVSKNKKHMSKIGKRGAKARWQNDDSKA